MPILRGSVTFARFRTSARASPKASLAARDRQWLSRGLNTLAFEPVDRRSDDDRAAGFVELEDPDQTTFSPGAVFHGTRALFAWRIDQLRVPGGQVREELNRWAQAFERAQGRAPARAERTRERAAIRDRLRAAAVPVTRTHDIAWNLKTGELQIWSASRKVVEEIAGAIETAFEVRLQAPLARAFDDGDADGEGRAASGREPLRPTATLLGLEQLQGVPHVA